MKKRSKVLITVLALVMLIFAFYPIDDHCIYCREGTGSSACRCAGWIGRKRAHPKCFFTNDPTPPQFWSEREKPNPYREDYGHQLFPTPDMFEDDKPMKNFVLNRYAWERRRDMTLGKGVPFNINEITLWDRIADKIY